MAFTLLAVATCALSMRLDCPMVYRYVCTRTTAPAACADPYHANTLNLVINELLEVDEVGLPSLMSKRLNLLTDSSFMNVFHERIAAEASDAERDRLQHCQGVVLEFLEEVAEQIARLEPELAAAEQEAQQAAAVTTAPAAIEAPRGGRCADGDRSKPTVTAAAPTRVDATTPMLRDDGSTSTRPIDVQADELLREKRAANRFKLHQLLDAANVGVEKLDSAVARMRPELDNDFFDHLQWEVDQQIQKRNTKLLGVLELIVQRTCFEMEVSMPEVRLLGMLLQTKNRTVRQELYARDLQPADWATQARFAQSVRETQMHLEKAVLRGEQVDVELLQQLRVIALEMADYMGDPL